MKLNMKRATMAVIVASLMLGGFASAGRTYHTEYAYFDSEGDTIGYATYPCYGPPILDGDTSGTGVLELQFLC